MFKIGDFSKICRVPTSALRYYADIGLLEPAHIDQFTGYRYYAIDQIHRLNRILALKDLGLSLDQIRGMLNDELSAEEIRGMLRLKQAEIQQHLEEESGRLARVAARLRQIEQEHTMPTQEVVLKKIDSQHVMSVRQVIPTPEHVGLLLQQTFEVMIGNGIEPAGQPFTIFHDEGFKPTDMDVEIAIPVGMSVNTSLSLEGGGKVVPRDIPTIPTAACIIHADDYSKLEATYTALGEWIAANGYRVAGSPHEVYLTAPTDDSDPVTEIQFPVEKA